MQLIHSMFAQKAWANKALFNALGELSPGEHAEPLHTMIRTLNHIYVVDRIFQAHLLGQSHGYQSTNTSETPELAALQFDVAELDAWYMQYASGVSASELSESLAFRFTDGDEGSMSREEMLVHVVMHGAYHRGNVGQVLKSISVAPPRDLYTKFLHESEPQRRRAWQAVLAGAASA
ncbi:MAG: damage-inducible protein DinB [Burkholderiales bacterium]|nr:damage-inducible protein DinB [Burkholderiales bacterium]